MEQVRKQARGTQNGCSGSRSLSGVCRWGREALSEGSERLEDAQSSGGQSNSAVGSDPQRWRATGVLRTVNIPNAVKCAKKVPGRFRVRGGYVRRALSVMSQAGFAFIQSQSPFLVEAILYLYM